MSRENRISPSFGGHRLAVSEQQRLLRRPHLTSLSNLASDSESNPTSTKNQNNKDINILNGSLKHQRQTSSIFGGSVISTNNISKKALALRKPQIQVPSKLFDINKLTTLISSKSIEKNPLPGNSQNGLIKSKQEKDIGKENIIPNRMITHINQVKPDITSQKRMGSHSYHEQELQDIQVNSFNKNYIFNNPEAKEIEKSKVHHRTVSQDQYLLRKVLPKDPPYIQNQVNIELDMLCQDKPHGSNQPLYSIQEPEQCGFDEETLYHLYKREQVYQVTSNYERVQPQISAIMRAVLIDWLTEVCKEFTLKRETLHLAVHNFDRFMARRENVTRSELQLVGVSSLYIACKIEEIYPPKVSDFAQASNYGFTNQQILEKELEICGVLKWFLNPPTIYLWSSWYMSQWDLFWKQNQLKIKFPVSSFF